MITQTQQGAAGHPPRKQPALFLPHGAPDLPISGHEAARFLQELGQSLPRPDGILIISAHWESRELKITTSEKLQTIYDFHGFQKELYQLKYPASTEEGLIATVRNLLQADGYQVADEGRRGLDHGAWVPLHLLYPEADIPVVQLSLNMTYSTMELYRLGQALSPLSGHNILVIGSGGTVHNLRRVSVEGAITPEWSKQFDFWLDDRLYGGDVQGLADYVRLAPHARLAHPTSEHLLPLFIAAGAGGEVLKAKKLHSSFSYGSIGMSAWSFGDFHQ